MTKHYGLLIWIPPFTMFTAEWWARLKNTSRKMGGGSACHNWNTYEAAHLSPF